MKFEDLINAVRARREEAGLNVHFLREDGAPDVFSFADADRAEKFKASLVRQKRVIVEREFLAEAYKAEVGYDPFEDDPAITEAEVAQALHGYRIAVAEAEAIASA